MAKRQAVSAEAALEKVEDGFEAEPEVKPEAKSPEESQEAKITRLQAENTALRSVRVEVAAPATPAALPQAMTQEQLQAQAESLGFTDPKQVESIGRIAGMVALPAFQKAELLQQELAVERTVNRAKKEAAEADPQFSKLEVHVDAYLDGISVAEKSDPVKMKKHMETATFYAKGKMGVTAAPTRRQAPSTIKDEGNGEGDLDTGDDTLSKAEKWQSANGKVTIDVIPRVSAAVRKLHAHPDFPGAVQINPSEEWQQPKFKKAE